jgi:hypothetical protein
VKSLENLKNIIRDFNGLYENKFKFIVNCLNDNKSLYLNSHLEDLNRGDLQLFIKLRNSVIELMSDYNKDQLIEKLINYGLDKKLTETIYEYCHNLKKLVINSKLIVNMTPEHFEQTLDFIIKKIFLYNDYTQYYINHLIKISGLKNSNETTQVLNFLHFYIETVSNRITSPELLKSKFENEFEIPEELSSIFYHLINENIFSLHQANLLSKVNSISSKVEDLLNQIFEVEEEVDEDNNNEEGNKDI